MASLISPTVARTRMAWMEASRRFPPFSATAVMFSRAFFTAALSRLAFVALIRAICSSRTVLGTSRISMGASSFTRYLLTPTMTSLPWSMRAWRRAADSSMRSFGMPVSMARAIPPRASISSMIFFASRMMDPVRASM